MSASETGLRLAGPDDLALVMQALRGLATDLGDPFHATSERVQAALFGPAGYGFCILAEAGGQVRGLALCNPILSTMLGSTAVYVSDLWVAGPARRQALGQRLLRAAMHEGGRRWQAGALRLLVYRDNTRALAFYRHLGFDIRDQDRTAVLDGANLTAFMGATT